MSAPQAAKDSPRISAARPLAQPRDHLAALVEIDDALLCQHLQHAAAGVGHVIIVRTVEDRREQRAQMRPELRLVADVLAPGVEMIGQPGQFVIDLAA